jgi:hypothetical protein
MKRLDALKVRKKTTRIYTRLVQFWTGLGRRNTHKNKYKLDFSKSIANFQFILIKKMNYVVLSSKLLIFFSENLT